MFISRYSRLIVPTHEDMHPLNESFYIVNAYGKNLAENGTYWILIYVL